MLQETKIKLHVSGVEYSVNPKDVTPETTLNTYLRDIIQLTGTKKMCLEGGCGACVVAVEKVENGKKTVFSVNSCLVSILSCHGWKIHTIEGIGSRLKGYHPIQKLLADDNGTQCGFCSGGMVMNMYALCEAGGRITEKHVEDSFGGNICRCTGYRPILTAFKKLALTTSEDENIDDIEDIEPCSATRCADECLDIEICTRKLQKCFYSRAESRWVKVYNVADLLAVLKTATTNYMLVGGNTAKGVYKPIKPPDFYIDITSVVELTTYQWSPAGLELGGNLTLTNTMKLFNEIAARNKSFAYLAQMAAHIDLVANVPVRNIGTLAGNLMIKHGHNSFQSDIFLLLETFKATLLIVDVDGNKLVVSPKEFLNVDMEKKVIQNITLSTLDPWYIYNTYKIMPRAQNVHAVVNAGFLFKLFKNRIQSATIVYGAINPSFVHATVTENFLKGKQLFDNSVLRSAFRSLEKELEANYDPPEASTEYRNYLAISLFYKFVLSVAPPHLVTRRMTSGGTILERPISTGIQEFGTIKKEWPLTEPVIKLEALAQTSVERRAVSSLLTPKATFFEAHISDSPHPFSQYHMGAPQHIKVPALCSDRTSPEPGSNHHGKSKRKCEAQYIIDMPDLPHQLFAAFVTAAAKANSHITTIDASEALKLDGVVTFMDHTSIPGENTFTPKLMGTSILPVQEELLCSGRVQYYDQPVGIIVATNQNLAIDAAKLVKVTYSAPMTEPYLTMKAVLDAKVKDRIIPQTTVVASSTGTDIKHIIKGTFNINWQYHFHMELQCANVVPTEDGLDMYPSAQWMDLVQCAAAAVCNIPMNKVNVYVRRLGGAFGAKLSRCSMISTAAALAAYKLQKPVKMLLNLNTNMSAIGRRFPLIADYEVGVNDRGVIQYMETDLCTDFGVGGNEPVDSLILPAFENGYNISTWDFTTYTVATDTAANCYARSPGTLEGLGAIESIMEHIAYTINLDASDVKLANIDTTKWPKLVEFWKEMQTWGDIATRKAAISAFNKINRWKKKGISLVPMVWTLEVDVNFTALVSIFHQDGTVAICHAGIEMGQGINTKAAQVCAYKLGIPLHMISVQPSYTVISPNASSSGGSVTSEGICYAVIQACDTLIAKMKPIKDKMTNPTWVELVIECFSSRIQLNATGFHSGADPGIKAYEIFGVCATEVEVDILTGQHLITRVDILEDTGESMSPLIDIGQCEGAFVMGIGYYTTEEIIFSDEGKLLTPNTWYYHPPGAKDIPINFRIKFPEGNPNPVGVLRSKAIAEPPICLSVSLPLAIRNAVSYARAEADSTASGWFPFDGPTTIERTFLNSLNSYKQYVL